MLADPVHSSSIDGEFVEMDYAETRASTEFYDSARRGPRALEEARGLWLYRDLIVQLARRNIVARYKRCAA